MATRVLKSAGIGALAARTALGWIRRDPYAATLDRVVSTLVGTPAAVSAAMTGTTRRSSVDSGTRSAPGRVDSPPTSIRSAPSAYIRTACSMAWSSPVYRPPSEKLSGVTLSTPTTTGRWLRMSITHMTLPIRVPVGHMARPSQ